ncbi:OsmC family protein [Myroides sp. LJL119]
MTKNNKYEFYANLSWPISHDTGSEKGKQIKNHLIEISGKSDLQISAAKEFKGDPFLHNPEDLLLSSLMSCHMMSYLYACKQNNLVIDSYQDSGKATLELHLDGSGKIIQVDLYPRVVVQRSNEIDLAQELHKTASKLCFIGNSCNFPIYCHPTVVSKK